MIQVQLIIGVVVDVHPAIARVGRSSATPTTTVTEAWTTIFFHELARDSSSSSGVGSDLHLVGRKLKWIPNWQYSVAKAYCSSRFGTNIGFGLVGKATVLVGSDRL